MFKTQIKVRYSEIDGMGIVHHSRYFPWFEVGRTEFFASLNMSYGDLERKGIWFPITDCYCKFMNSARYEDKIFIFVAVDSLSVVKCKFIYEIRGCADNKLIAEGYTSHAFTNSSLKPINIKKIDNELYQKLMTLCGDLK